MHLSLIRIENFRLFGEGSDGLVLPLQRGLTALVGENDSGKTAIAHRRRPRPPSCLLSPNTEP